MLVEMFGGIECQPEESGSIGGRYYTSVNFTVALDVAVATAQFMITTSTKKF